MSTNAHNFTINGTLNWLDGTVFLESIDLIMNNNVIAKYYFIANPNTKILEMKPLNEVSESNPESLPMFLQKFKNPAFSYLSDINSTPVQNIVSNLNDYDMVSIVRGITGTTFKSQLGSHFNINTYSNADNSIEFNKEFPSFPTKCMEQYSAEFVAGLDNNGIALIQSLQQNDNSDLKIKNLRNPTQYLVYLSLKFSKQHLAPMYLEFRTNKDWGKSWQTGQNNWSNAKQALISANIIQQGTLYGTKEYAATSGRLFGKSVTSRGNWSGLHTKYGGKTQKLKKQRKNNSKRRVY
jgi:hypothetical protein